MFRHVLRHDRTKLVRMVTRMSSTTYSQITDEVRQFLASLSEQGRAELAAMAAVDAEQGQPHPMDRYTLPSQWARECIRWREGEGLTPYQERALDNVFLKGKVALRGPHTAGKTTMGAILVLFCACKWEADASRGRIRDWIIVTTASYWVQVEKFLWRGINMWSRYLIWSKIGLPPFVDGIDLLSTQLKLPHGIAFGVAPLNMEGAHASRVLWLFDEMRDVPDLTFEKAEGAMAGAGADTDQKAYAFGMSTPGMKIGKLYRVHARVPGNEDWYAEVVTAEEAIACGRMSREWYEQRKKEWGEDSAAFLNRARGEFSGAENNGVIPLAWLEAANRRWAERVEAGTVGALRQIGVDVAGQGKDKTVFAPLFGHDFIDTLRYYQHEKPLQIADRLFAILSRLGGRALVDVLPDGSAITEYLDRMAVEAYLFNGGEAARNPDGEYYTDRSGTFRFRNRRSHMIWNVRELLDPALDPPPTLALPPDDNITGDFTVPRYVTNGNVIQVESKDDMRRRLKQGPGDPDRESTDAGDAVGMALYPVEEIYAPETPQVDTLIIGARRKAG